MSVADWGFGVTTWPDAAQCVYFGHILRYSAREAHPGVPYPGKRVRGASLVPLPVKKRQETGMSKSIKSILAVGLVAMVAACASAPAEEFVVVEPEPISMEPVYTGKYK